MLEELTVSMCQLLELPTNLRRLHRLRRDIFEVSSV